MMAKLPEHRFPSLVEAKRELQSTGLA